AKTGQMRAAIPLWDIVGEAEHRLVVAVGPLHRDLEQDVVAFATDHDWRRMQSLLRAVEVGDKGFEPALEMQGNGLRLYPPQIAQDERHAAVQKGELAESVLQGRKIELSIAERLGARQKGDLRAGCRALAARAGGPSRSRSDFGER